MESSVSSLSRIVIEEVGTNKSLKKKERKKKEKVSKSVFNFSTPDLISILL